MSTPAGCVQPRAVGSPPGAYSDRIASSKRAAIPRTCSARQRPATITRFVNGEFRYVPVTYKRVSPYVIMGVGRGVSRPNVTERVPDRVSHEVTLVFPGFGAHVEVTEHLSAFADLRIMFQSRAGEPDAGMFGPIRGGPRLATLTRPRKLPPPHAFPENVNSGTALVLDAPSDRIRRRHSAKSRRSESCRHTGGCT
jgi:hypothetical protein